MDLFADAEFHHCPSKADIVSNSVKAKLRSNECLLWSGPPSAHGEAP